MSKSICIFVPKIKTYNKMSDKRIIQLTNEGLPYVKTPEIINVEVVYEDEDIYIYPVPDDISMYVDHCTYYYDEIIENYPCISFENSNIMQKYMIIDTHTKEAIF